jgi:hypothetical protein
MATSAEKVIRYTLGILLLVVTVNALGGGYYGMAGAKNIPLELLKGSPFRNYFIPGLFLFFASVVHVLFLPSLYSEEIAMREVYHLFVV